MNDDDHHRLPAPLTAAVDAFVAREHGLFVGGRWRAAAGQETLQSVDPATGRPLARIAKGTRRTSTEPSPSPAPRWTTRPGAACRRWTAAGS